MSSGFGPSVPPPEDPALADPISGAADHVQVALKRLFDIVCAAVAAIVSIPVWTTAVIAILLETGPPVLYRSRRVGRHGVEFDLLKFRSMVNDTRERGRPLTVGGDPRITRVGAVLRRWRIDELPNLVNVLLGDISIVGPRPESPKYVEHYSPEERRVLQVKPGITDIEFVRDYRYEEEVLAEYEDPEGFYVSELMPKKVKLNLEYVDRFPSLTTDLKILLLSVWTGIFGESLT